jgi:cysteine desulfurase
MAGVRLYFDHAATTPMVAKAKAKLNSALDITGNPASLHEEGQRAKAVLEKARDTVANLLGVSPSRVVFTSGATEAASQAIVGVFDSSSVVIANPSEHACVLKSLAMSNAKVEWMPVNQSGVADIDWVIERARTLGSALTAVVLMGANNETGVIMPVAELADRLASVSPSTLLISDLASYGACLSPVSICPHLDAAVFSAHKLGGPVGIGVLVLSERITVKPILGGGRQEWELRPGTQPHALAASAAAAMEEAWVDLYRIERVRRVRDAFESRLAGADGIEILATDAERTGISAVLFQNLSAEELLFALDQEGLACSYGAACASGALEPSHVVLAMGRKIDEAKAMLRFSFSPDQDEKEAELGAGMVLEVQQRLLACRR